MGKDKELPPTGNGSLRQTHLRREDGAASLQEAEVVRCQERKFKYEKVFLNNSEKDKSHEKEETISACPQPSYGRTSRRSYLHH